MVTAMYTISCALADKDMLEVSPRLIGSASKPVLRFATPKGAGVFVTPEDAMKLVQILVEFATENGCS